MIKRKKTRSVRIGKLKIGGGAPIAVQSMTKTETSDVRATVSQIKRLEASGCEVIRVAVKNIGDADAIQEIKNRISIPLVCDIHFDYRLALKCIEGGADKIRLNPGNIRKREDIEKVVARAKSAGIPIRIGVNSGSVADRAQGKARAAGKDLSSELVGSAVRYIKLFEEMDFRDIIISLKASDVATTVEAYRKISGLCDYPLHLGVTASGPYDSGIIKSSIGIGALLLDGIGDTIRVSLTADPADEVISGRRILSSLKLRNFGPEIISCPTCGRCQVDLVSIVSELDRKLSALSFKFSAKRPVQVAVMGCEVNGPGEAKEADIGIAAGKGSGVLFKKGKPVRRIKEKDFIKELMRLLKFTADS